MKAMPSRDGNANTSAYSKALQDLAKKQQPISLMSGAQNKGFGTIGSNFKNLVTTAASMTTPFQIARGYQATKDLISGDKSVGDAAREQLNTLKEIPLGFVRTGSNILDALPYVDTGEPGLNYANEWRRGTGLTTGITDALNIFGAIGAVGAAAKAGRAAAPRLGAALDDYLAMTPAGQDAGVLYYGGRERPKINLGPVQPRKTAAELAQASGVTGAEKILSDDYARLLAEKMAELAQNTAANVAGKTPPRVRPRIILDPGKIAATEAQALDKMPDWLKPIPSADEVTKMLKQAEEYAQPNVMNPKRAAEVAKPARWENQQLWPDKWDNVNVSKEMDLTRRFANVDEALMAGPEVASKWSAQQAFREDLLRRAQAGDTTLFDSGAFPSYVNERTMGTYLQIVELPKLLTNPVIAEEYVRFMQLFKP